MDTKKLRQKILDLAIHGKLVPQDPNDEPASVLLERIHAEKERLIAEGKIKRSKKSVTSDTSHYENVPFEVPEGWCWCSLDDLCTIINGNTVDKSLEKEEGQIAYLRVGDMNLVENKVEIVTSKTYLDNPSNIVPINSFIFPKRGGAILTNKKRKVKQRPIWIDLNLMAVNVILPDLFEYIFLHFSSIDLGSICNGGNIPQINTNDIAKIFIPLPPLLEQNRIVVAVEQWMSFVDSIESCTTDLLQSVQSTKSKILDLAIRGKLVPQNASDEPAFELLKRINPKAIASCDNPHYAEPYELPDGWTWCKLIDICTFLSRGKSPKYSETDTTYPVFAQKCNLREGGISLEKAQFLEPTTLKRWPDVYHLQTGDVLVNSTGTGTVGRTRLFNESCLGNFPFVVPDSHVSVIRTHGEIVSEYIFALMSSSWIQTYLEDNLAGSTNQKELYIGVLQNVDVPLPPVMEQTRIADKIESLYQQLDNIANHIE